MIETEHPLNKQVTCRLSLDLKKHFPAKNKKTLAKIICYIHWLSIAEQILICLNWLQTEPWHLIRYREKVQYANNIHWQLSTSILVNLYYPKQCKPDSTVYCLIKKGKNSYLWLRSLKIVIDTKILLQTLSLASRQEMVYT